MACLPPRASYARRPPSGDTCDPEPPICTVFLRRLSADTGKRNEAICAQPANIPPSQGDPAARWNNGAAVHLGPPAGAPVPFYAGVGCKTAPGGQGAPGHDHAAQAPARAARPDDADRCDQAARLRREFRGWIVIWLARDRQYKAYRRMPGPRRDTALAAAMPEALAAQITQAEQAAPRPPSPPGTSHDTLGRHRVADARDRRQRKSGDELKFVVDQSPARSW